MKIGARERERCGTCRLIRSFLSSRVEYIVRDEERRDKDRVIFICLMDRSQKKSTVTRWEKRRAAAKLATDRTFSSPYRSCCCSSAPLFLSFSWCTLFFINSQLGSYKPSSSCFFVFFLLSLSTGGLKKMVEYKGSHESFCLLSARAYFDVFFFFLLIFIYIIGNAWNRYTLFVRDDLV